MVELLVKNDDVYKAVSDDAKESVKSQGNIEAFELFELTDTSMRTLVGQRWRRWPLTVVLSRSACRHTRSKSEKHDP